MVTVTFAAIQFNQAQRAIHCLRHSEPFIHSDDRLRISKLGRRFRQKVEYRFLIFQRARVQFLLATDFSTPFPKRSESFYSSATEVPAAKFS